MTTPWHKYPYWSCPGSHDIRRTVLAHACSVIHGLSPRPDTRTPTPSGHEITFMKSPSLYIIIILLYILSLPAFSFRVKEEIIKD